MQEVPTAPGNAPRPVGVIGLGRMGGGMTRTLLRAGKSVVAWDPMPTALDAAVVAGASPASSPADVASRASLVITSVPDAAAIRLLAFGQSGLVEATGADLLVIDTSTISPSEARELSREFGRRGMGFLDAPVSGGVHGAETGSLAIMVGGTPELFGRAQGLLRCLGRVVVHCGPPGSGQISKACNQLIVMATHEAVAEALVLAQRTGVDPWRVREALLAGYAGSPILELQAPKMLQHDFAPGGKAVYHLKDIATIAQLAGETGLELPAFKAAAQQIQRLVEAGGGDLDHSALVTVVEGKGPTGDIAPSPGSQDGHAG